MTQHFLFPDRIYPKAPQLEMGGSPAATNLAAFLIKLAVDTRLPRPNRATGAERDASRPRLERVREAAAAAGFVVEAVFRRKDLLSNLVRVRYRQHGSNGAEIQIQDRPLLGTPTRRELTWHADDSGLYQPDDPIATSGSTDIRLFASAYASLVDRATNPDHSLALDLSSISFTPYPVDTDVSSTV